MILLGDKNNWTCDDSVFRFLHWINHALVQEFVKLMLVLGLKLWIDNYLVCDKLCVYEVW